MAPVRSMLVDPSCMHEGSRGRAALQAACRLPQNLPARWCSKALPCLHDEDLAGCSDNIAHSSLKGCTRRGRAPAMWPWTCSSACSEFIAHLGAAVLGLGGARHLAVAAATAAAHMRHGLELLAELGALHLEAVQRILQLHHPLHRLLLLHLLPLPEALLRAPAEV